MLFYKLQGEEMENFKAEDFMIVLHTEFQASLMKEFVYMDSTHGTNVYDFTLTTLMVIDEFGHGQPVWWFLSNHETYAFIEVFLNKIRNSAGKIVPPWFMTDMANQYYDAFSKVILYLDM